MSGSVRFTWVVTALLLAGSGPAPARAQEAPAAAARVPVEEVRLTNGMRFLLVERPQSSTVSAGWVARVGSAYERPGETGLSHFIEHLLFKGSRTVSARQIDREIDLLGDLDRVAGEIARLEARAAEGKGSAKSERKLTELRQRFAKSQEEARDAAFLSEFSLFYSQAGATGLNANTLEDLTMFYVTVPAEKLELWFWLESDRLLQPIFREFHKEKRVVREERRLRVESTPTGPFDVEYRRLFWGDHPYGWLPLGSQADIDAASREQVKSFFAHHYRADNLTAVLVGNFDRKRVAELAQRYFGRLSGSSEGGASPPKPLAPASPPAEPLVANCDCPPQLQLRYPTVPFRHPDSYKLQVLAGVLNGRTGRLYRSLVLENGLAYSASVLQHPLRRAGSFLFSGESRGSTDPAELRPAWDAQVDRLAAEPIPAAELEKVKNQITAEAYRRLQNSTSLMRQLLIYDGLGEWRHINDWPERILRVSAPEIGEVARRYLAEGRPAVAIYRRTGAAPADRPGAP
jgi:predicted Zn-dependent peptidase